MSLIKATTLWFLALPVLLVCSGCGQDVADVESAAVPTQGAPRSTAISIQPESTDAAPAPSTNPKFVDVAAEVGLDFQFFSDAVPRRYWLPEIMGGGAAWIDADADGQLDLYLMNGATLTDSGPSSGPHGNRLFQQIGARFVDVSHTAGSAHAGYGQGVAAGDFDGDGFTDLYLANWRDNCLLHNNGDGTFDDVSTVAGVPGQQWSTSVAWCDINRDGLLDLYVTNYLDINLSQSRTCRYDDRPGYCGPGEYAAVPDDVYLSQGDGTFHESARDLGLTVANGKGLAVSVLDLDNDLQPEIYVANDMTRNFLFTRTSVGSQADSNPHFREVAMETGCGLSDTGRNEASMGIATADFDSDGQVDLFLTHYFQSKNTLYRNLGELMFDDDSRRWKVAATSYNFLGFGIGPLDWNRDGRPDVFIANGHVLGPEHEPNQMTQQLLWNDGNGFHDVSHLAGPYFSERCQGRGVSVADFDTDGESDLELTHQERTEALLRNDTQTTGHFLGLEFRSTNRIPPVGGRVLVEFAGRHQVVPITAGGSYLSSGDRRLLIGLGDGTGVCTVTVYWPNGRESRLDDLPIDRYWQIIEQVESDPVCVPFSASGF